MIRIQKSPTPPEGFADKARAEAQRLCDLYNAGQRSFGEDDFKAAIYGSLKDDLITQQHGKCCFCEANATANMHGDVEHYRPKAAYKQARNEKNQKPGYYWLTYDWDNLFFACQKCNQTHKSTLFPLANPTRRATSHFDDIAREEPFLLHPANDDPEAHISFDLETYFPVAKSPKGAATIDVCGLDRIALQEDRRATVQGFTLLIAAAQEGMPHSASARRILLQSKEQWLRPQQQYSSVFRAIWASLPTSLFDDIS